MKTGAVILCGGKSSRMGRDKASLPFGEGTLLSAVVARAREAIGEGPLVCVAAEGQPLPQLTEGVAVVRDRRPGQGPLEGLASGLEQLQGKADAAVALGCDAPLVAPAALRLLLESAKEHQAAAFVIKGQRQPLLAAYRLDCFDQIAVVQAKGKRSLMALLDALDVCELTHDELLSVDPDGLSLLDCNDDAAYESLVRLRGEC